MALLYNLKAVVRLTGVPAATLRVWEQRYGMPRPERDERGHRVYSEADVRQIRDLKGLTEQGVTIRQAVRAVREGSAAPPAGVPGQTEVTRLVRALQAAVHAFDERRLAEAWDGTLLTLSLETGLGAVILPTLARLGPAATPDERARRRFALSHARGRLAGLLAGTTPTVGRGSVLAAAEDEDHEIPLLAAGALLRARGVPFVYLGPGLDPDELSAATRWRAPRLLLLAGRAAAGEAGQALHSAFGGLGLALLAPEETRPAAVAEAPAAPEPRPSWAVYAGPDPVDCALAVDGYLLTAAAGRWPGG